MPTNFSDMATVSRKVTQIIMKKSLWPNKENPIILFVRILLSNLMDCCRPSKEMGLSLE
jgi:hypothetical protein